MSETTSGSAAVVGLGSMGGAMAAMLSQRGWQVLGYDASADAAARAAATGVRVVASVAELAGVEQVLLSLPGAEQVRTVTPQLLALDSVRVVVDTSTSDPQVSRALAAQSAARDVVFVDAPVSGGAVGAAAGALAAFVGAAPETVRRAAPLLDAITGGSWRHMGPPGAGNVTKLLNNALCAGAIALCAEAVDIAAGYGLDPATVITALNGGSGRNAATEVNFPRWILSGTYDSGFTIGLMTRDVVLASAVADRAGATHAVIDAVRDSWKQAARQLPAEADFNRAAEVIAASSAVLRSAGRTS